MRSMILVAIFCGGCCGAREGVRVPEPVKEAVVSLAEGAARVAMDVVGAALKSKVEELLGGIFRDEG